ncbi:DUF2141 domain-containing protein [Tenacibaculum ovolyticum]|uniref:DUF2141 domain-containing protein n=1 Tax=Tenacibaculum ovolyticum TaxID=104270 RepID=UPI0022F3A7FA|nr:DUF2141 domain-containing protein [Tenacibaculum ovolyticum]WBX75134.1 DUF2141 domain-containing protein [Tenacibaculum ovolyticum]
MKFLTISLLMIVFFVTEKLTAQSSKITVTVINATSDAGKVSYALYNKENFRKEPILAKSSVIKEGKSIVVFNDVPKGEYAVICFHDKNDNDKMDFQANGMPIEDYGVSTNNINRFGPPVFEDAKFTVIDKDVSLEIKF